MRWSGTMFLKTRTSWFLQSGVLGKTMDLVKFVMCTLVSRVHIPWKLRYTLQTLPDPKQWQYKSKEVLEIPFNDILCYFLQRVLELIPFIIAFFLEIYILNLRFLSIVKYARTTVVNFKIEFRPTGQKLNTKNREKKI